MSPFHLLREFKKAVGVPPHAYLVQRRVDESPLAAEGRALKLVAIEVGYSDQAHFGREFRRFYGVRRARRSVRFVGKNRNFLQNARVGCPSDLAPWVH